VTSRLVLAITALALVAACSKKSETTAAPVAGSAKPVAEGVAPPAAATEAAGAATAVVINGNGVPRAVGPVATVNGKDIPADRFNGEFERLVGRSTKVPADRMRRIAQNVLNRLIEQELREQAIHNENITLTDAEFEDAWREFTARFRKGDGHFDEAALNAELERSHTSMEKMREQIRQQRLASKLVQKLGKVEVSEADGKAFYDNNPSAWVEAASRDLRPILIRVQPDASPDAQAKAEQKAQEASAALKKGQDFEQVAKQYSEGPMPPLHLTRASAEPELEPVAFQLKVGEVSKPIKTRWGWYVLRLIEKNDERTRPYNEVRDEIRSQLMTRRGYTEERRILQELRKKAEVVEKLPF
jgi:peptidyl-prolyl cis-trans isomerase C